MRPPIPQSPNPPIPQGDFLRCGGLASGRPPIPQGDFLRGGGLPSGRPPRGLPSGRPPRGLPSGRAPGAYPSLIHNSVVGASDPGNLAMVILHGVERTTKQADVLMPDFGSQLT